MEDGADVEPEAQLDVRAWLSSLGGLAQVAALVAVAALLTYHASTLGSWFIEAERLAAEHSTGLVCSISLAVLPVIARPLLTGLSALAFSWARAAKAATRALRSSSSFSPARAASLGSCFLVVTCGQVCR